MNPAERLLATYDKLIDQPGENGQSMARRWAVVFFIPPDTATTDDEVFVCLQALRSEIDFVRGMLSQYGVPPELSGAGFNGLRHVSSPAYLHQPWDSHKGNVMPPDNRLALQWAAWVLRDEEESVMSTAEFQSLQTEIEALEISLRDTEMAQYLRDFIQRQVDTIRAALKAYDIQGSRPLKEALRKVVGDFKTEEKALKTAHEGAPDPARGVFAMTATLIDKAAKVCDGLSKVKKTGEEAIELVTTFGPLLLPYVHSLLR